MITKAHSGATVVIVGAFARGLLKRWVGALCGGPT
jgi:hypothetical protein